MSNFFREGSPLDKHRGVEAITDFDRKVFASMSKALWLPDDFKEYMVQYMTLNQPPVPIGQMFGSIQPVDHTLVLSASGGGSPTVGDGVSTARYSSIARRVHYFGKLTLGSTTNFGTGTLLLSLPEAVGSAGGDMLGFGEAYDDSTGNRAFLHAHSNSGFGSTTFQFIGTSAFNGAGAAVSGTSPFPWAWASGDILYWNLLYESL